MSERLKEKYKKEVVPSLMKDFKIKNPMAVAYIQKITVNSGIGSLKDNRENIESFRSELSLLLGQVPMVRKAKKSISAFKLREGEPIGISATLRGDRMWAFLDKLISIVLPRVKDFRGVSLNSFDSQGNYALGLDDHTIFPEVNPNKVRIGRGLQVNIVLKSPSKEQSKALLAGLGFPFEKKEKEATRL